MAFNFFKKKKDEDQGLHYDPLNIKIQDIRVGFFVDYGFKTWEVTEEYEYDWGDDFFSYEFKFITGDDECFLSIDTEDGLELVLSNKIRISQIEENIEERITKKGKPPQVIIFKGKEYYRDSESAGFYRNTATTPPEKSVEMMSWDYYDDSEKFVITIEQWGEGDFEASQGKIVGEFEFSNITPSDNLG